MIGREKACSRGRNLEFEHMKMQPDRLDGVNVIARHEPGKVWVNASAWERSVVVPWRGAAQVWDERIGSARTEQDLVQPVLDLEQQVLVRLGGRDALLCLARLQTPAGDLLAALDAGAAARPRGRLPRERLVPRLGRRPAARSASTRS